MINWLILVSIGIALIVLELMTMSFVFIFFGLGFIAIGILSIFIILDWQWQLLLAFLLSFIMLFLLKRHIKRFFNKEAQTHKDNFLDEKGNGVIKEGMVYFKGTFWKSDDLDKFKEGDKVEVLGVLDNNKLKIKGLEVE